jgi:hypothetical protein
MIMEEAREYIVKLWANIIRREITEVNFWFQKNSSWKDIDVIGIKPGENFISLYNVKSNLNTDSKSSTAHSPESIAHNFIDAMEALNLEFNRDFNFKLFLIFESADRLGTRKTPTTVWLREIHENLVQYYKDIEAELKKKSPKSIIDFNIKSIHKCVKEINNRVISLGKNKVHCFKFENEIKVYPFHKIPLLKFMEIYSDYDFKNFKKNIQT